MRRLPLPLLLTTIVLAACSSEVEPEDLGETAVCPDFSSATRYQGLTLAPDVSGIAFRSVDSRPSTIVGTPCAGGDDACQSSLTAATSFAGWPVDLTTEEPLGFTAQDYGVVTRGSDVKLITSIEELGPAILPIDSPTEAITWLRLQQKAVDCTPGNAKTTAEGFIIRNISTSCNGAKWQYEWRVTRDGRIQSSGSGFQLSQGSGPDCIEGRRPAGLVATKNDWLGSLRAHFAEIAHLEAASVIAFGELARDLARLGAPEVFVARALAARRDEIDHAARTNALAQRFGARPTPIHRRATECPSLFELARANAVEGCVRETYGALVARYQAMHASDPEIRAAFERIAADEAAHAAFSHDLAEWFESKLLRSELDALRAAEAEAIEELAQAVNAEVAEDVQDVAGMPGPAAARDLLRGMRLALFSPAHRAA